MPQLHAMIATMLFACGAMVLQRGIYLYTAEVHAFTAAQNLAVSVLYGVSYIVGAAAFAPRLGRRRLVPRMAGLAVALGLVGLLMNASGHLAAMGLVTLLMGGLIGSAWPLLNGMILADQPLAKRRVMIGRFNVSWAVGVPLCMLGSGWLLHHWPRALPVFACLMLACVALVLTIGRSRPAREQRAQPEDASLEADAASPVLMPVLSPALIWTGRWGMVVCYSLIFTLIPVQPAIFGELGYTPSQAAYWTITFDIARLSAFCVMIVTPVWQGSFTGLAVAMLSAPLAMGLCLAGGTLPWVLLGHVGLGAAAGYLYYAPLVHGMTAGRSAVSSTGKHEAVRGVSLVLGPMLGLLGASVSRDAGLATLIWTVVLPAALLMLTLIVGGLLAGGSANKSLATRWATKVRNPA
jgi:hypothetical protein